MKIATILSTPHIWLADKDDYHLCLAHQIRDDLTYTFFFRSQIGRSSFVIMDNGAAEFGESMSMPQLISMMNLVEPDELILPDFICDYTKTIIASHAAYGLMKMSHPEIRLMGVPQGSGQMQWEHCAKEMISWGIDTIGLSKFVVPNIFPSRVHAMESLCKIIANNSHRSSVRGDTDIHLLGYTGVLDELKDISRRFPDAVRGVDSSIALLWAQVGEEMPESGRPKIELDLNIRVDEGLLLRNIEVWRNRCST